jgi:hypothetical protein
MLNLAEQTGSGAVIVVWSFLHNTNIPTMQNAHAREKQIITK